MLHRRLLLAYDELLNALNAEDERFGLAGLPAHLRSGQLTDTLNFELARLTQRICAWSDARERD
jgi:hypothetical protein